MDCSTPENGVLSLVDGEIVPMKAAASRTGYDSLTANARPATAIRQPQAISVRRRPQRSANRPSTRLASTEPAAATARSRPVCQGSAPSWASSSARSTLVHP